MFVYMIRAGDGGPIKIGKAGDVERRIADLQTANYEELKLVAVIPCVSAKAAEYIERGLHKRFRRKRIRGEWFDGDIKFSDIKEDIEHVEGRDGDEENAQLDSEFASIIG